MLPKKRKITKKAKDMGILFQDKASKTKKSITAHKTQKKQVASYARVFVAGGSRPGSNPIYEQQAFELGKEISRQNYQLTFGLSSRGIMGAVAKGVMSEWLKKKKRIPTPIQGITTQHYKKLYPSDDVAGVKDIVISNTLEQRKANLLEADFVIFAPGGVGTLDELSYNCIAMQDGFLNVKPFVLFNVDGFFHHLLEYLKDIHIKGFSDSVPFIVVDNIFEVRIAFEMIDHYYDKKKQNKQQALDAVNKIVYNLPYVIEQQQQHPNIPVSKLLKNIDAVLRGTLTKQKQDLQKEMETAYLNKEIARMYDRLAKTGRDTALVSHKLSLLKNRQRHGGANGFY